jgi:DNA polymerase-3 subunit delta'
MNIFRTQPTAWTALQAQRGRLPHALLLIGQRGVGKLMLAEAFAASLLCEAPASDARACGQCPACNWFHQGHHPDYRLLQPDALNDEEGGEEGRKEKASQQIVIEQVRALDEFLAVGTHRGGLRIIVVNPAEAMNRNTSNALLKTLEEPPSRTLFLLISNEPMRLLPTIRSRCQTAVVKVPAAADAARELADDGVADAARWLALAGGAPGVAAELAASGAGGWLDLLTAQLGGWRELDPLTAAAQLEKAVKESKGRLPLRAVVDTVQKWAVDLNLAANGLQPRYFLPHRDTIAGLADMIPPARLIRFYRGLHERRRAAESPLNARLFFESLFIDYRALTRP